MALGDMWLALANGECSPVFSCPNGPCGPGENDGDDCPAFWTHTAEYDVSYDPAVGSVLVDGIPRNPGEVFAAIRGDLTVATPLEYPIEFFRGEIETAGPSTPPTDGSVSFTISNITPDAATLYGDAPCVDAINPSYAQDYSHNFRSLEGTYVYFGTTSINVATYDFDQSGGGCSITTPVFVNRHFEFWRSGAGGFGKSLLREISTGQWYAYVSGSKYYYALEGAACSLSASTITGVAGWSGDVAWSGWTPSAPLPAGFITWAVLAYPNPRQTLIPATEYSSIPLEAAPGEAVLEWGKFSFADQLRVTAYPAAACSGKIRLTIRSACENPPP